MFKLDLEKAEEPAIKFSTSTGSQIKQESSRKTSISALLTMSKPLTVWISTRYQLFNISRELIPRSYLLETHHRVLNRDFQC